MSGGMPADLLRRWRDTVPETPATVSVGAALVARYRQPHRRYHDLTHLREVLAAVDELASYAVDADAVRLAAWFHDAVYAGRPGVDEEDSARLAEEWLPGCGVCPGRVDEVARLVRLTVGHAPAADDRNGAVLCDADLAILAAGPARYVRYASAVRAEYAHVPDDVFRRGRLAVLEGLLNRAELYRTPIGRQRWSAAARRNLAGEIRQLTGDVHLRGAHRLTGRDNLRHD